MGGSLSEVHAQKICKILDMAMKSGAAGRTTGAQSFDPVVIRRCSVRGRLIRVNFWVKSHAYPLQPD
jgi:hypothetical protein